MISIIIPVYNEANNILILANKITNTLKKFNYEVLFINDGSNDETEKNISTVIMKKFQEKLWTNSSTSSWI